VIDGATSSGDAERTKPEPDIIEAALRLLSLDTDLAVYVHRGGFFV